METLAADLRFMQRTPLLPEHVEAMRGLGQEMSFRAGQLVARTGERMDRFYYLLEGEIEVLDPLTGERYLPNSLGPSQFMGEISFLNGGAYSMSMRAAADTRVIAVERTAMLDLMSRVPEMSDIIISVFAARRRRQLDDSDSSLVLIGGESDPDIRRIASFAGRNKIPFKALELQRQGATATPETVDGHGLDLSKPAVVFGDKGVVGEPTPLKVARLLGLDLEVDGDEVFDVIIVGGGPAGVAAAVYAGAEGLSALVIEDLAVGGQAGTSSRIENYMGFPTGISGADLVWRGEIQAMKFGTRFAMPRRVQSVSQTDDGLFQVTLEDDGRRVRARSLVVATGVQYRRLPLPKLAELEGAGIYYAATEIEARYCRGTEVIVVGGGNSAGQAAMYLSRSAKHVHVLIRGQSLAASMSDYLLNRLESDPRITIQYETQLDELHGDQTLNYVTVKTGRDQNKRDIQCQAVFVMVGAAPYTEWLSGMVALDDKGFVKTGEAVGAASAYATSHPGIFAVGDVRSGSVKRVASAVGEGSVVISKVWEHVNST